MEQINIQKFEEEDLLYLQLDIINSIDQDGLSEGHSVFHVFQYDDFLLSGEDMFLFVEASRINGKIILSSFEAYKSFGVDDDLLDKVLDFKKQKSIDVKWRSELKK